MATTETLTVSRTADKVLDHYKSSNSKTKDEKRRTAAERLEADKLKYVKSDVARKRRPTVEREPAHGAISSSASFGGLSRTPIANSKIDEQLTACDVTTTASSSANRGGRRLNRSSTDANERLRKNRFRTRSIAENSANTITTNSSLGSQAADGEGSGGDSLTDRNQYNKPGKSLTSYLNKAKESLKSVTSTIAASADVSKSRQSRSTQSKPSKHRSSSVGANAQRQLNTRLGLSAAYDLSSAAVSPRSQLKNARQGLKKVISPSRMNENATSSPSQRRSKTFLVVPKQSESHLAVDAKSSLSRNKSVPLAIIDNTVSSNRVQANKDDCFKRPESKVVFHKQTSKLPGKEDSRPSKDIRNKMSNCKPGSEGLSAQERLRVGSSESTNTTSKPVVIQPTVIPDSSCPQLSNTPRQRRSWGRAPTSTEFKKSGSRVSFHEESFINQPGSRKSISEALEDLLNPLDKDDDIDTAYNSMSPEASLDFKTVVGTVNQHNKPGSGGMIRPKTPDSSRSQTPTCDDGISFQANDINLNELSSYIAPSKSSSNSPHPRKTDDVTDVTSSEPLRAAAASTNNDTVTSSMMAPKERKEIAPDYSLSNKGVRGKTDKEVVNTLQSQNTMSSTSGDISKPFTALTAADLKPRREVAPLKPSKPHPAARGNSKRPNETPVPPNLSPSKQESKSSSSTPYSSLKRTPASSINSSLKRSRQRSKSDVSLLQNELDRFFSTMGMDDSLMSPLPSIQDTLFTTAPYGSESDFSFAGASAYVRDSLDESMDIDPTTAPKGAPSVSIIEKNARVVRWLMSCKKSAPTNNSSPRLTKRAPPLPTIPPRPKPPVYDNTPPPIPPRVKGQYGVAKESNV